MQGRAFIAFALLLCCSLFVNGDDGIQGSDTKPPSPVPYVTDSPISAPIFGDGNIIKLTPPPHNRTQIITFFDEEDGNRTDPITLALYMVGSVLLILGLLLMLSYGKRLVKTNSMIYFFSIFIFYICIWYHCALAFLSHTLSGN